MLYAPCSIVPNMPVAFAFFFSNKKDCQPAEKEGSTYTHRHPPKKISNALADLFGNCFYANLAFCAFGLFIILYIFGKYAGVEEVNFLLRRLVNTLTR